MPTQAERTAATRSRILAAARALFVTVGYEPTTTSMILTASGTSRGAMYYHFDSKGAVFEELYLETARRAIARSGLGDPGDLLDGCMAWLKEASRPDAATMLFDLAPAVMGWRGHHQLEAEHGLAVGPILLRRAADRGTLKVPSVDLAGAMLSAALAELALRLAHSDDSSPNPEEVRVALAAVFGQGGGQRVVPTTP
jgi:AcrR family transcriptional regulator